MKKILGLAVAAMMVMAMVGAGTWAFFSDTEQSAGNILTAGILDLTTGGVTQTFSLGPVIPGDSADPQVAVTLTNSGSSTIAGDLAISIGAVTNLENTITDPESDEGDVSDPAGELGGLVEIAIWLDEGNDGWDDSSDYYLTSGPAKVAYSGSSLAVAGAYETIDSFDTTVWTKAILAVNLTAGSASYFKVSYRWIDSGDSSDNMAQSDSATFDITFTLTQ